MKPVRPAAVGELVKRLLQPIKHLIVEDCWYSCPKSGECCDDRAGDDCLCGADEINHQRKQAAVRIEQLEAENERLRDVLNQVKAYGRYFEYGSPAARTVLENIDRALLKDRS